MIQADNSKSKGQQGTDKGPSIGSTTAEKLGYYIDVLERESEAYEEELGRVRSGFEAEAREQIDLHFKKARKQFEQHRRPLLKELNALQYYSEGNGKGNDLYPLFTRIDETMDFNRHLIRSGRMKLSLPQKGSSELDDEVLERKAGLLEDCLRQVVSVLRSDPVRKYCKKEVEAAEKSLKYYQGLIDSARESVFLPEVR